MNQHSWAQRKESVNTISRSEHVDESLSTACGGPTLNRLSCTDVFRLKDKKPSELDLRDMGNTNGSEFDEKSDNDSVWSKQVCDMSGTHSDIKHMQYTSDEEKSNIATARSVSYALADGNVISFERNTIRQKSQEPEKQMYENIMSEPKTNETKYAVSANINATPSHAFVGIHRVSGSAPVKLNGHQIESGTIAMNG